MTATLARFIGGLPSGCLAAADLMRLITLNRLQPVLVRCGGGRFTCPAQDAAHFMLCAQAGGDYVRDASIPVKDCAEAARLLATFGGLMAPEPDGVPVPVPVLMLPHPSKVRVVIPDAVMFDEGACGGAWDGRQVSSDADPGL